MFIEFVCLANIIVSGRDMLPHYSGVINFYYLYYKKKEVQVQEVK